MDMYGRLECLPGTRTDLLKSITEWVTDPTSKHNVLWLHGVAGCGKSTLAIHASREAVSVSAVIMWTWLYTTSPATTAPIEGAYTIEECSVSPWPTSMIWIW